MVTWLRSDACQGVTKGGNKYETGFVAGVAVTWQVEDGSILAKIVPALLVTAVSG